MSSRHRSSTYYADRDRIVTPGLSSYRTSSSRYADVPRYMPTTSNPREARSSPRYHDDTYTSSRSKPNYTSSSSRPSTSDKGLSYTSTRDLGGWLGGAALTAGAAYLLRGGGGSSSRDRGRSRERESRSSGRRYHHDDGDYYSYREKSRRRGKSEGRGERRRSSRYYYD